MAARALPLERRRHRAGERQGIPGERLSLAAADDAGIVTRAGSHHRRGLARRGAPARAAGGSAGSGAGGLPGAVQQRLPGRSRAAFRRGPGAEALVRGGRDPGSGADSGGRRPRSGWMSLACGGAEVAAVALGLGIPLRPARADRPAEPVHHRLAGLRGHRLQPGLGVRRRRRRPRAGPATPWPQYWWARPCDVLDDHHVVAGAVVVPDAHEHRHRAGDPARCP